MDCKYKTFLYKPIPSTYNSMYCLMNVFTLCSGECVGVDLTMSGCNEVEEWIPPCKKLALEKSEGVAMLQ